MLAPARGRGRSALLSGVWLAPKASLGGAVEGAGLADHSSALLKLPVERWRKTENSTFLILCYFLSITEQLSVHQGCSQPSGKVQAVSDLSLYRVPADLAINYMDLLLFSAIKSL